MNRMFVALQLLVPPEGITSQGAVVPPGSAGFLTILGWGFWGAFAVCMFAIVKAGGLLALGGGSRGSEHPVALGFAVFGAIVTGAAGTIMVSVT